MQQRIVAGLFGAGAMLLLVVVVSLFGLPNWQFPSITRHLASGPSPIVIPSPSAVPGSLPSPAPTALIVPTPTPNQYAMRFRELPIPAPGGTPYAIIVGPDGGIWFTEAECTSGIGHLSTTGEFEHWSITGKCGPQPLALTKAGDGNVWFAEVGSAFGRITPHGDITTFAMSTPAYPLGITTGPDGRLWIACASPTTAGFIARVGLDGKEIAEYPLSKGVGEARGIVTGPDGAMWFTESTGIGRLTLDGTLKEFPLPQGNGSGQPYQIAVGPDRNLWFVEYMPEGDGRIGRLTPSGALTEFRTPNLGGLQWITAGPDDAMWFTAAHTNNIGRISLDGAVWSYAVPSLRAQPVGITTGPDGNIWFTEEPGDLTRKLGVFTLS